MNNIISVLNLNGIPRIYWVGLILHDSSLNDCTACLYSSELGATIGILTIECK